MAKKCICFSRVSSYRQSLTAQKGAVKTAALKEYKTSEIIEVSGKESAIKLDEEERQTLNELKSLVEQYPTIESVYFFAVDRLARRVSIVISIKEWADEHKINLVFLNPYPFSTWFRSTEGEWKKNEISDIYLMFLGYGAKMEMEIKKERFANAKAWMRKNNKVTGKILFGYTTTPTKDVDYHKKNAPIIRWIFDCYLKKNMSTQQIFKEGFDLGYWGWLENRATQANKIRAIMRNKKYAGICEEDSLQYPPIVSEDEIDEAINKMKERRNKPTKILTNNIYYCKGILRDEPSNTALIVDRNHVRYRAKNVNTVYGLNINICDSLIWQTAYECKWNLMSVQDDSQKEEAMKQMEDISTKIIHLKGYIEKELSPKYTKAYNAYINSKGRITLEMYNDTISTIEKEQKALEREIQGLEKRETELSTLLQELDKKDKINTSIYTIREISDDKLRMEIINECITNMTINKISEKIYVIKVHSLMATSPNVYVYYHRSPNKNHTYWITGTREIGTRLEDNFNIEEIDDYINEGLMIEISDSIEKRYIRIYR